MSRKMKWILAILFIVLLVVGIGAVVAFFTLRGGGISETDCADGEDCAADIVFDGLEYSAFCEPLPEDVIAGLEAFAEGNVLDVDVEFFELPDIPREDGFGAVFAEESPACGGTEGHLYVR